MNAIPFIAETTLNGDRKRLKVINLKKNFKKKTKFSKPITSCWNASYASNGLSLVVNLSCRQLRFAIKKKTKKA